MSVLMPRASWMTTTPGHGPSPAGAARRPASHREQWGLSPPSSGSKNPRDDRASRCPHGGANAHDDLAVSPAPRARAGRPLRDIPGLCAQAGLVGIEVLAIDGARVHASASRHANIDCARWWGQADRLAAQRRARDLAAASAVMTPRALRTGAGTCGTEGVSRLGTRVRSRSASRATRGPRRARCCAGWPPVPPPSSRPHGR
jgi:hypothetical protein